MICLKTQLWILRKNEKLISEVLLLRANSLFHILPEQIQANQIIPQPCLNSIYLCNLCKFKSQQDKGQSIYSCDPHDLKLAERLAKHSVMLKLFSEQQASLQANQLKGCQTCQPIFSTTVLFRLSRRQKTLSSHILKLINQEL